LGIPAAGTPAISDESMSAWMEYLYMQQPKPDNATGVPVSLVAIASDGTVTDIGTATSDSLGIYATHWQVPETPGVYKIYVNFAGTNSYYASEAETAITVVAAETQLTADDVASQVIAQLPTATPGPSIPTADEVANQVISQLPSVSNVEIAIIAVVVIAVLLGIANLTLLMKKK
jgi:hypothetical protein